MFGEIDCRLDNGIIPHRRRLFEKAINQIISKTVENYLSYVFEINSHLQHNIIIHGIPCPNIDTSNHTKKEIAELIEVIKIFNSELEDKTVTKGFDFLDVHKLTDRGDGFSNGSWHIDYHHLSPEGFLEAWSRNTL